MQRSTQPVCTDGSSTEELTGTVKFYNDKKGYGYMTPDGYKPEEDDVVIRAAVVNHFGQSPREGARIRCRVSRQGGKLKAEQILVLDHSTVGIVGTKWLKVVPIHPQPKKATVKNYREKSGYGFLTVPGEKGDIFVHATHLQIAGLNSLRFGQEVWATYGLRSGRMAVARLWIEQPAL